MTTMRPRRILILGGTTEAFDLAAGLIARFGSSIEVISSQAGRTKTPRQPEGAMRVGGFGGIAGLAKYLVNRQISLVIDASHPFAKRISANARAACHQAACPRLIMARPPWRRHPDDIWHDAANTAAAVTMVAPLGTRIFLTLGHKDLKAFAGQAGHWFLVRVIEPPLHPLPLVHHQILTQRGPFDVAAERDLLNRHRIDVLVTKASGGQATQAKLIAAREAGLPVVMIRRPLSQPGEQVDSLPAALQWVSRTLGFRGTTFGQA